MNEGFKILGIGAGAWGGFGIGLKAAVGVAGFLV